MKIYQCLTKQQFSNGSHTLVPLRDDDKYDIMQWRNEQIFHLRQVKPLTLADQENYFNKVVAQLFNQEKPSQLLFSYLQDDVCIGYGGLVHINWIDRHAEISFLMNTTLEKESFDFHWTTYLQLIEQVAFSDLKLHKIYTYSFEVRPHLYPMLAQNAYQEEARLREHCLFNGKYIDVLIHSKWNTAHVTSI
jgi:RimJ/RimL family protein N-acetyltransferase